MKAYLAAHDEFVAWLKGLQATPALGDVENRLWIFATIAAARGMTKTHWTFVVDGLIAHANRVRPGDILLSSYLARGFDLVGRWNEVESEATLGDPALEDKRERARR